MSGNDQSFDVDAYLRYIFGEENEPEQVGEQELHRSVQAPWPIGSDIGHSPWEHNRHIAEEV